MTLDALEPFRRPMRRPEDDTPVLACLDSPANRERGAIDNDLEVWLQTDAMRRSGRPGDRLSQSNFADAAYGTVAQLLAHHTVNGCALSDGEARSFIEDGDTVILGGGCRREGRRRIGFGECRATVRP